MKAIKPVSSIKPIKVKPHDLDVHELQQNISFYISKDFLVMPASINRPRLVIFDLVNNKMIDENELFNWNGAVAIRIHHLSRTLYAIVGKTWHSNSWSER